MWRYQTGLEPIDMGEILKKEALGTLSNILGNYNSGSVEDLGNIPV